MQTLIGLMLYTLMMGGVYILNQITDVETDRLNKKLFLLSEDYLPLKNAYIEMFSIWSAVLLGAYLWNINFFILMVISLTLGILYSLPPFKLKGKPILDMLSNGFGYGILNFFAGWLIESPFAWEVGLKFLPYFFCICAVFINTTIVDLEGDKKAGEITTAVFLGEKFAYFLASVLMLTGFILSILYQDLICLIPSGLSLPLFFYLTFYFLKYKKSMRKIAILSFRLPGLIFTIITCILYPGYIPFLMVLILSMRIYYKKRFNLEYPTLTHG